MTRPAPVPLYLVSSTRVQVDLEDAALVISSDRSAQRWLPLTRLSRIVANEQAQLSTAALMACAAHGITTLFIDDQGRPAARVMGRPGERQELRQRLVDLLTSPDGEARYQDWLRSQRRRVMLEVGSRLRLDVARHPAREFPLLLEQSARRWADAGTAAQLRGHLEGLAYAWMANHLNQLGIGAQSEALQDGAPDLFDDLGGLFAWYAEPLRVGLLRRRHERVRRGGGEVRPVTRKEAIRSWQRNGARFGRAGRELSNRLHRWLVETA